ncbi:ferritin-like superfamily [Radiomyces spectabilis]|uniref:ferritin-like superfamily n=1 Tax=Radiomyces spectabilis TaxID=64574 RepID=UPI00221EA84B|nr:ferritin-like superfamily [Radiomyces spectabilis]KAI8370313.1 ferritin-like superfamily [Radiomyces spectabilis]
MPTVSLAKQNFSTAAEDLLNTQIRIEQIAQHTYLAAAAYFGQDTVALPGLEHYFLETAEHQGRRVQHLIDYLTMRGGETIIQQIPQPPLEWESPRNALETSLMLEKDVNKSLLNLTTVAIDHRDTELEHHMKQNHLMDKVKLIEHVVKGLTQLERVNGTGLGLHLWDQELYRREKFPV